MGESAATRRGAARWACLLACGLAVAGCAFPLPQEPQPQRQGGPSPPRDDAGPGGRAQPLALTPQQEWAVGTRAYHEVLNEVGRNLLPADSAETQRVRRVVGKLVHATENRALMKEIFLHYGYRFAWEVNVVRDKQVNAFCLPAGFIFVYTGLLRVTGDDDDYLATVLSHEMAHALAHHSSEKVAREQQRGGGVLRDLSHGRMQESEADHIGVFLMPFAGFEPEKAVGFWQKMQAETEGRGKPPEFLSDHPSAEHRARDLRAWAPRAKAAKKAFDEGHVSAPGR